MTSAEFKLLHQPQPAPGYEWFASLADRLLNQWELVVNGKSHRLKEVEFYYYGKGHLDPFAHRHPLQLTWGRWYFHREGESYRGGSFKGLDLSFGPEEVHGGILFRTGETAGGEEVNGCSLWVDHLVRTAEMDDQGSLDEAVGDRKVWRESELYLRPAKLEPREVVATARVGLTLKRMADHPDMPRYLMAPYRFLTDLEISKGKIHTVMALHQQGKTPAEINEVTRTPKSTIEGYVAAYEEGHRDGSFEEYDGKGLKTADLCRIHGMWQREYGG